MLFMFDYECIIFFSMEMTLISSHWALDYFIDNPLPSTKELMPQENYDLWKSGMMASCWEPHKVFSIMLFTSFLDLCTTFLRLINTYFIIQ